MQKKAKFEIKEYCITSNKIPENFSGTTAVFLTDLHNRRYGDENLFLIDAIERQHPDYVFVGGDMIVGHIAFDTEITLQLLKHLSRSYPVYYSQGNHEQRIALYEETKDSTYPAFVEEIKSYGVHYLINEHVVLERDNQSIRLSGLSMDYVYYKKNGGKIIMSDTYLNEVLGEKTPSEQYQILLAHNPKYFALYAKWGADLVLSGHVHGGIMILPWLGGVISPSYELFPKYDFGQFQYENSTMVLSRGLGTHTILVRINNRPELSVIRLKKT